MGEVYFLILSGDSLCLESSLICSHMAEQLTHRGLTSPGPSVSQCLQDNQTPVANTLLVSHHSAGSDTLLCCIQVGPTIG